MKHLALFATILAGCAVDAETTSEPETVARVGEPNIAFTNCIESIGVTLVATDAATALVPAGVIPVGAGTPVTPAVVRTARCGTSVDGSPTREAHIIQVGLVIVPPATPGDIDNYTLGYVTDDLRLAAALTLAGVNVRIREIDESLARDGSFAVAIGRAEKLALTGHVTPSAAPSGTFTANWWQATNRGLVEMTTGVPVIDIGGADLSLTTTFDPLAALLGSSTTGFPILQQFNQFATAALTVTHH
jgi:hypothetical protein